jgi:hypothetical protein
MTAKLRLGPIPKNDTVKLTITLHVALKADLDRYADLHSKTWGASVDAVKLIPHMLETFIARDRGFRRVTHETQTSRTDKQSREERF